MQCVHPSFMITFELTTHSSSVWQWHKREDGCTGMSMKRSSGMEKEDSESFSDRGKGNYSLVPCAPKKAATS